MRRVRLATPLAALLALLLVGGGLYAYVTWSDAREAEAAEARRQERLDRRARAAEELEEQMVPLRRESAELMPPPLAGVELGMTLEELRAARSGLRPGRSDAAMDFFEEVLSNNAQVMYGVDREMNRVSQVQVLSRVPVEGVAPHLVSMNGEYGTPTGIWNCPASGAAGVPTRRFTWRRSAVTIQDIFLLHPSGVSVTLYIAPTEIIGASLRISHCTPVRSQEELAEFPVATPEQMQQSVEETGRTVPL